MTDSSSLSRFIHTIRFGSHSWTIEQNSSGEKKCSEVCILAVISLFIAFNLSRCRAYKEEVSRRIACCIDTGITVATGHLFNSLILHTHMRADQFMVHCRVYDS